jgi:hypothetical protein
VLLAAAKADSSAAAAAISGKAMHRGGKGPIKEKGSTTQPLPTARRGAVSLVSKRVECVLTHTWTGGVLETIGCLQDLTQQGRITQDTLVFLDALCLYLPDDPCVIGPDDPRFTSIEGSHLGLMQTEQEEHVASILASRPKLGVAVLHTTRCDVYKRAWAMQELRLAKKYNLPVHAAFDRDGQWGRGAVARFLSGGIDISASSAQCTRWRDRAALHAAFKREGFAKVERIVRRYREAAAQRLREMMEEQEKQKPQRRVAVREAPPLNRQSSDARWLKRAMGQ